MYHLALKSVRTETRNFVVAAQDSILNKKKKRARKERERRVWYHLAADAELKVRDKALMKGPFPPSCGSVD